MPKRRNVVTEIKRLLEPGAPSTTTSTTVVPPFDTPLDAGDAFYQHEQMVAADTWPVTHNLGKYPSVTVVDSGGNTVIGDVQYVDDNSVVITFSAAFSGVAYLN